jgi:hypothetical protein
MNRRYTNGGGLGLLCRLDAKRERADRATDLLEWALQFHQLIDDHGAWLDLGVMHAEVEAFKEAVRAYKGTSK